MIKNNYIAFKCNSNVFSAKSVSSASCQWLVCRHMHIVLNIFGGAYVFGSMRSFPRGVTWVKFCWVCAAGLSKIPHYSHFGKKVISTIST